MLSSVPWAIYCSTHLVLTSLFDGGGISYPPPKLVDTLCPLIDAVSRSAAITAAVEACRAHAHPAVRSSLFVQLFLGAVASAGGSVTASTLGVWEHDWRLRRPAFVDGGIVPTLDVWGGSLAAFVYGFFQITHPWYGEVYEAYGFKPVALLTPLAARSTAVLVLTVLYVTRVYHTHYAPIRTVPVANKAGHPKAE